MATMPRDFEAYQEDQAAAQWDALGRQYQLNTSPGGTGDLRSLVAQLAPEYGVDPTFAMAIAQIESNFQAHVISSAGAKGVMQLMDGTAKRFKVRDSFDPEDNIRGGLKYLAVLQDLYPGRRDLQAAAYNAGEGAVEKYGKAMPPYPETQQYVQRVQGLLGQTAFASLSPSGGGGNIPPPSAVPGPAPLPRAAPPRVPDQPPTEAALMPDITGVREQPAWVPARKPIEPGLQEPMLPAFLGSMGVGLAKGTASLLEAPNTAARLLGLRDAGNIGNAAESIGQFLRESVAQPTLPRGEQPPTLMHIGEGIGQAASFLLPGMAVEHAVAALARQAPAIAAAMGATTSGVLQGAVAMHDTYQAMRPLVGEEEAASRAKSAFGLNTLLGTVGSALGIFNVRVPEGLARVVAGAASQGVQGAIQYDITRREFWVPKNNPNTPGLLAQGWEDQGDRVAQPYRFKDQLEAALVQTVVGGVFAGAHELSQLPVPEALKPFEADPGFSVDQALHAALTPDTPPADVPLPRWQRWAKGVLDLLPEPGLSGGLLQRLLGSERGSLSPERLSLVRQRNRANQDLLALEAGGEQADAVVERLGVASPAEADTQVRQQMDEATRALAALPAETVAPVATPPPPGVEGVPPVPGVPPLTPPGEGGRAGGPPLATGPTLQAGAEGVTPDRYRTESGSWRVLRRDMPTAELEVQDAIRQQGGINLSRETDVPGELRALISPRETGIHGLLNNQSGLSLQQMAETLQQHGFLGTADKNALLHVLDRSVNGRQNMYSTQAQGRVPLLDNAFVEHAYRHTLEAIQTLEARTEAQRRGTRPHAEAMAEAQGMIEAGLWTPEDLRTLAPGTMLDDAGLGAVVLSATKIAEQLQQQAQKVVETGGRPGSKEVQDYLTIKAMFAEVDPARKGVVAEAGRALSFLNDPMSSHNRYLDELHAITLRHGEGTVLSMARQDLAIATPEERLATQMAKAAEARASWSPEARAQFEARLTALQTTDPALFARMGFEAQGALFSLPDIEALAARPAGDLDEYLGGLVNKYGPGLPGPTGVMSPAERAQATRAQWNAKEAFLAQLYAESGQLAEAEIFRQRHVAMPLSPTNDPTVEEPWLLAPQELRPRREEEQHAVAQKIFLAKLRAESGLPPEGERFQTYRPRGGIDHPRDEGTPLMVDAKRAATPELLAQITDWRQQMEARIAREERDPLTRNALLGEVKIQYDGIMQQYQATYATRAPLQAQVAGAHAGLRAAQANLGQARPGFAEMWTEQTTAAMLGPTSWIRNEIGNAGMGIWALGTRFLAEQLGRLHPNTGVAPGETAAMLWGMTHGEAQHWQNSMQTWTTGESQFTPGTQGKTDVHPQAVTAENVGALMGRTFDPNGVTAKVINFWANWIGFLSGGRLTHRILNTRDEYYKSKNYSMETNALAFREAQRQGMTEGSAFTDHAAKVMSDPNVAAEINQGALDQAIKLTLQDPAKPGGIAETFTNIAQYRLPILGTEQEFPVGRLLLPFIKIPMNSVKFTMENTPLAALSTQWRQTVAAGGPKADIALAQVILGSSVMAAIAMYVGTGNVTGRAPDNPVLRDDWLKAHPEYSTRVPFTDIWVPYRIDPIGNHIAMVADAAQIMGQIPHDVAQQLAVGIGYSFIKNLWSQTAAQNINDFFGALSPQPHEAETTYGERLGQYALKAGTSAIGVPLTGGLMGSWSSRAYTRFMDPAVKDSKELLDQAWKQTPWSTLVPAHRTLNGDPMLLGVGVGPEAIAATIRAFSPLRPQESLDGPADKAIVANNIKLSYPSRTLDPTAVPEGAVAQAGIDYRTLKPLALTDRQYERLKVLTALNEPLAKELFPPSEGRIIPAKILQQVTRDVAKATIGQAPPSPEMSVGDMMDWIATQPKFTDDGQSSPGPAGGKAAMLKLVVAAYRRVGTQLFLELDPSQVGERLRQSKIQHVLDLLPEPQRGAIRPTLEQSYRQGQRSARDSMGLPPLPVGAQ